MSCVKASRLLRTMVCLALAMAIAALAPGLAPYEAAAQFMVGSAAGSASRGPVPIVLPGAHACAGVMALPTAGALIAPLGSAFSFSAAPDGPPMTAAALNAALPSPAGLAAATLPASAPPAGVRARLSETVRAVYEAREAGAQTLLLDTLFTGVSASAVSAPVSASVSPRGPPRRASVKGASRAPGLRAQWADMVDLIRAREVKAPALFSVAAATAVLLIRPLAGIIALHELGHYLMARILGLPVAAVRLHYDGGGYIIRAGTGRSTTPARQLAVSLAGPAFSLLHTALALGAMALSIATMLPPEGLLAFMGGIFATVYFLWVFVMDLLDVGGWESDLAKARASRREITRSRTRTVLMRPEFKSWLAKLSAHSGVSREKIIADALALLASAGDFALKGSAFTLQSGRRKLTVDLSAKRLPRWDFTLPSTLRLTPKERNIVDALKTRFGYSWSTDAVYAGLMLLSHVISLSGKGRPVVLRDGDRRKPIYFR
ncbi:MAG: site-2 protease family protein [Elusimicrobiota bacterium]